MVDLDQLAYSFSVGKQFIRGAVTEDCHWCTMNVVVFIEQSPALGSELGKGQVIGADSPDWCPCVSLVGKEVPCVDMTNPAPFLDERQGL